MDDLIRNNDSSLFAEVLEGAEIARHVSRTSAHTFIPRVYGNPLDLSFTLVQFD